MHKCRYCAPAEGDLQQESNASGVRRFFFLLFFVATFIVPYFLLDDHRLRDAVFGFTCGAWFWGTIIYVIYAILTSNEEIEHSKYVAHRYNNRHGRRSKLSSTGKE